MDGKVEIDLPTYKQLYLPTIQYAMSDTKTTGIILIGMRSQRTLAKK